MDAPAKHNSLATMPLQKTKVDNVRTILCLPDGKRIIVHLRDGSFQVLDLETGTQVGEEWEDRDDGVWAIALSPDGKKVVSGRFGGAVKLWSVDTGKVIKTWTGHTAYVNSVSWSPDGGRVVSGSYDGTFRVWDVESGKTILGPINTGEEVRAVCYSPDAKMIATGAIEAGLKIWDANSGELLKTLEGILNWCLAWTLDGKTLISGGSKFDTATWTDVDICEDYDVDAISISLNDRILATISYFEKTAQLWDLETNQPIGTLLHHQENVRSATFSVDGKFLLTCCNDEHVYTWDVSAIAKRAGLPSDIVDVTPRPAPKIKGARVPPGFFDDALREANLRIRLSQSHAPPTPTPHQRTFNPFTSVWRSSEPHVATESTTQSSRPFSWTRNLSSILRRRDRSDIQRRDPLDVPATLPLPFSLSAQPATRFDQFETGSPPPPSNGVVQSLRQHLSFLVPRHSHGPPVVEVAPGRKFTRLAAAKLPDYKKVDDTRHSSSQQGAVPQDNDSADVDSLPDVHWCKAFLCYSSCLSHGRLRMPPRWRLERIDIPRQDGTANSSTGGAHSRS